MGYGLRATNSGGSLTFSSEGMVFGYIGKATNTAIQQAGATGISDFAGYSTYTINWPGAIIVALPLAGGKTYALRSMSRSGSTWTIAVYCGSSLDARGFIVQEACEVFVYGAPVSISGWGAAIRNSAGALTGDLSRRPLFFNNFFSLADGELTKTIPLLTKPAFIGAQPTWVRTTEFVGGGTPYLNIEYGGGWGLLSSTVIERRNNQLQRLRDDGPWSTFTTRPAVSAILIEAADLT